MKFGGTSQANPERIRNCAQIVLDRLDQKPLVVVSAISGVTDELIAAAKSALGGEVEAPFRAIRTRHMEILEELGLPMKLVSGELQRLHELLSGISLVKELTLRTLDFVMSFGEMMSSKIMAAQLREMGGSSEAIPSYELGFMTDSRFSSAQVLNETYKNIPEKLAGRHEDRVVVTTGFIGKNHRGEITTIGRSGSDYTAAVFGAALGAEEIQIWKDVDGVMTADPHVIGTAKLLDVMSFAEAGELAYYGAEVLHPSTIAPAVKRDIPVRVLNTLKKGQPGTVIVKGPCTKPPVKSVVYKEDLCLIDVFSPRMLMEKGFMARLFNVLDKHGVVIDMIATSEVSLSMTTDSESGVEAAVEEIEEFAEVSVEKGQCIVCLVGEGMSGEVGTAARVFGAVRDAKVNVRMISQGAREINVAFLIRNDDIDATVKALHREFFE
ncbi:MAG: aspartate kinase [Planctomycetota bacterium]